MILEVLFITGFISSRSKCRGGEGGEGGVFLDRGIT